MIHFQHTVATVGDIERDILLAGDCSVLVPPSRFRVSTVRPLRTSGKRSPSSVDGFAHAEIQTPNTT